MAKKTINTQQPQDFINVGSAPNSKDGDSLRAAFARLNDAIDNIDSNFSELYTAVGQPVDGNLRTDIVGSVFANDSSVIVDSIDSKVTANTVTGGSIRIVGHTIDTVDSSSIIVDQSVSLNSNVTVGGDILPETANGGDLGSSTLPWRSLYVSNNTIYIGGTAVGVDANGNLTTGGTVVGSTPAWNSITGKPTFAAVATSGAYADLTGKPTIPTDFRGSVFADDSTLMVDAVDNKIYATELTVAVGNFVNVNSNNVDVENINGLASQINFTVGGSNNLVIENNLVTIQNVSLSVAGDITLGGNIRSEGNINIDINLSDSTLRRWQFGEDGGLTLPGGKVSIMASTSSGSIRGSTNTPIIVSSIGSTGSSSLQWVNNAVTPTALSGVIVNGGGNAGDVLILTGTYNPSTGALDKSWTFGTDGNLTIPGELHGAPVMSIGPTPSQVGRTVNITPADDASDKKFKFRIDQYGETFTRAYLELPTAEVNKQVAAVFPHTNGKAGYIYTQGADTNGQGMNDAFNIFYNNGDIKITSMGSSGGLYTWKFGDDGALTLPGDIRSEQAINIDINLADSTLRRWQFGEDGELTLPEDAVVKTISGNLTIEGESYVFIDSATNGQIDIGRSSGVGAVSLGNKSNGTSVVVDDLVVANGVYEFLSSLADATGVVTHNCANGHIFYHTSPDANWTVNLTNLLDTWNRATSVTIIIAQGATGYYPSAVQIAGVAQTINWQGNATPTPSTNRTDVVTFSIINNSGTYIVLGQLTGY